MKSRTFADLNDITFTEVTGTGVVMKRELARRVIHRWANWATLAFLGQCLDNSKSRITDGHLVYLKPRLYLQKWRLVKQRGSEERMWCLHRAFSLPDGAFEALGQQCLLWASSYRRLATEADDGRIDYSEHIAKLVAEEQRKIKQRPTRAVVKPTDADLGVLRDLGLKPL